MKILFFSPAPSNTDPNMCPFILKRIEELQNKGIEVEVLQYGNLTINKFRKSQCKGLLGILGNCKRLLIYILNVIIGINIDKKLYDRNNVRYVYYDRICCSNLKSFHKWFKKNHFDFIHGHFLWFAELLPELKEKFGIPYVITCHGSDVHETPFVDISKQRIFAEILNNHSFFVSDFLRKKALEFGFNNKKYSIIYNGVDSKIFFPKNNINENNNFPVLGFSGHTIKVKRVEILPQVLFNVRKVFPNASLLLVGGENSSHDLTPFLREEIKSLGLEDCVILTGAVLPEEVPKYMRVMDVLLLPSINEGFGCVAVESQFCGVPVIGSANGGIPEAVFTGICVSESDDFVEDFSNAVIKYLKNPLNKEIVTDRVKNFTWEDIVDKEIKVYEMIMKQETRNKKLLAKINLCQEVYATFDIRSVA